MGPTIRAGVTELEAYRRFLLADDAELDTLLMQLRRQLPGSERMNAGKAFHRALELASHGEHEWLCADGFVFLFDAEAEIELPELREIKATLTYPQPDGGALQLVGVADAVDGLLIHDHKTSAQMDAEGYMAGWQWRLYLEIFGADHFRWNVFEVREAFPGSLAAWPDLPAGRAYIVHGSHQLEQHRYPGLATDCERLVAEFYQFALTYLPERCAPIQRAA